jgi:hypothetical protein
MKNRRREPYPWGIDRPAGPCKVYPLDPQKDLERQIDRALFKFGTRENGIAAIWLPDSLKGKVLDKVAGIPVKYTRFIVDGEIWIEMRVEW